MSDVAADAVIEAPETVATYLRLRGLTPSAKNWKRKRRITVDDDNAPFTPGRDPGTLGDVLDRLSRDAGWETTLAREDLVRQWADLAGADTAKHSEPVSLERGLLTVKCDSTAWAKNLQFMRATILTEIGDGIRKRASRTSASSDRTSPPGNGVPESFQDGARAIPTGRAPCKGSDTLRGPHAAVERHIDSKPG